MKKIIFIFLIVVLLLGTAFSYNKTQVTGASDLRLAIRELIRLYEEEELKELRKIYTEDITLFLPDNPFRIHGMQSVMTELEQYFKDNSRIKIALRQVDTQIEGNVAVENGYYSTNSVYRNERMAVHGRYTRLWRKSADGEWRCFHEHVSYIPFP